MPQHPFPDPGLGGEEPDSSPLPPAAEEDGPEGEWEDGGGPAEQGLYVCLPDGASDPGRVRAGRRGRHDDTGPAAGHRGGTP